jgi:PIN domain nuclease of toxin-antitoxin system
MAQSRPAPFVADTHTLWWYLKSSHSLSSVVADIIQSARDGNGTIIVPAIVVAELYYLSVRERQPLDVTALLEDLAAESWIELTDLGSAQLEYLDRLPEVPEMHDRLIAAESAIRSAPLLTVDQLLTASEQVQTIW